MSIGERIRDISEKVGGQKPLAELVDVSPRTINAYISGDSSPQIDTLIKIAHAGEVDPVWLFAGAGLSEFPASKSELVKLPRFDIQASAGAGSLVTSNQPNGLFAVDRDWLSRYVSRSANVGVIEASGDSMIPTISNRDLLLVEVKEGATVEEIMRGGIYVLTLDGGLVVKRLEIDGDELVVISDNPAYPQVRIAFAQIENRVIIHGVVFWSGGALETHR